MNKAKVHVLIIEDDPVYRFIAVKTIAATGLAEKIDEYANGRDALNYLELNTGVADNLPDIIFIDISMPLMDGWEFIEAFKNIAKRLAKNIPVYFVTSSIDENDRYRAREIPLLKGYLVKPVQKETFRELLQALHL